jgi:hypothetical protein
MCRSSFRVCEEFHQEEMLAFMVPWILKEIRSRFSCFVVPASIDDAHTGLHERMVDVYRIFSCTERFLVVIATILSLDLNSCHGFKINVLQGC